MGASFIITVNTHFRAMTEIIRRKLVNPRLQIKPNKIVTFSVKNKRLKPKPYTTINSLSFYIMGVQFFNQSFEKSTWNSVKIYYFVNATK